MKLSERTIQVLKNFSTISQSILVRPGSVIKSMTAQRSVIGRAEVDEVFEKEFAIYDLSRFLSAVSLFDKPEVTLSDNHLTISSDKSKLKYVINIAHYEINRNKTRLMVAFKPTTGNYDTITNKGEHFNIMATVVAAVKELTA